jgi:hypothetical protein
VTMVSFETGPRVLHLEAGYWIGPTPPHCRRESDHQRALQVTGLDQLLPTAGGRVITREPGETRAVRHCCRVCDHSVTSEEAPL